MGPDFHGLPQIGITLHRFRDILANRAPVYNGRGDIGITIWAGAREFAITFPAPHV